MRWLRRLLRSVVALLVLASLGWLLLPRLLQPWLPPPQLILVLGGDLDREKVAAQVAGRSGLPVLVSGGSNSASWRQIIADLCDVPVRVCNNAEGAAFGAALQALQILAPDSSIEDIANNHVAFDNAKEAFPSIDNVARYQDYYHRYQDYVSALRPLYKT